MVMSAALDIRRSSERFTTALPWLTSRHSFSFGPHYDPANTGFAQLVAHNADVLAPGGGFGPHPHRDVEILTWVLQGALQHEDDQGNHGLLTPGMVQCVSAGRGIVHSEHNASTAQPLHLVQLWVLPDRRGGAPSYVQRDVSAELARGGLVRLAAGRPAGAALLLQQPGAVLWAARLAAGEPLALPVAAALHLYVAAGTVDLEREPELDPERDPGAGRLRPGDAVRLTAAGAVGLRAHTAAEILVYEMTR